MKSSPSLQQLASEPPRNEAPSAQQRLIGVARDMFCRDGIHATGIDRILAEAGVSKMTLYARFGSKEALVREVLKEEGATWRTQFFEAVNAVSADPQVRLSGVIAAMGAWFGGDRFYGCAFMNAIAEHSKGEAWLRALATEHQQAVVGFLAELAEAAGRREPKLLARQIMLLIDGAIAAHMVSGDLSVLDISERNLRAILEQDSQREQPTPG